MIGDLYKKGCYPFGGVVVAGGGEDHPDGIKKAGENLWNLRWIISIEWFAVFFQSIQILDDI